MSEPPERQSQGEELKRLLNEAFPDLRCLRCGNDSFSLTYDLESELSTAARRALLGAAAQIRAEEMHDPRDDMLREIMDGAYITLVCERCGMIERHLRPALEHSEKPIKIETATHG